MRFCVILAVLDLKIRSKALGTRIYKSEKVLCKIRFGLCVSRMKKGVYLRLYDYLKLYSINGSCFSELCGRNSEFVLKKLIKVRKAFISDHFSDVLKRFIGINYIFIRRIQT